MYFDGEVVNNPLGQRRRARHLRHPLRRRRAAVIVLIPAYEPGPRPRSSWSPTCAPAARLVVVVDDGSGPAYAPVFDAAPPLGADVLTHAGNRGKGAALKTGFATSRAAPRARRGVRGQRRPARRRRHRRGGRAAGRGPRGRRWCWARARFTGDVPLRSRFGNA